MSNIFFSEKHVFLKTRLISYRLLQVHLPSFHNLLARGESTSDSYAIMANNQDVNGEYEWNFHFQNLTLALYSRGKSTNTCNIVFITEGIPYSKFKQVSCEAKVEEWNSFGSDDLEGVDTSVWLCEKDPAS